MMKLISFTLVALLAVQVQATARSSWKKGEQCKDGKDVVLDTTYHVLIRCGDVRPHPQTGENVTLGEMLDRKGRPLLDNKGAERFTGTPDYTSYRSTPRGLFTVVQMEDSPAQYFALTLEQDFDGHMRVASMQHVNTSDWEGSIRPCAGSISPWETHMGGEESYPDVREFTKWLKEEDKDAVAESGDVKTLLNYNGYYLGSGSDKEEDQKADSELKRAVEAIGATYYPGNQEGKDKWFELFKTIFKPYMIGHIFEINSNVFPPTYRKHMAMGRSSFETALIMPDQKTVYLSDDSSGGGLLKFVAKRKGDLSVGTLYAGKFKQTTPDNGEKPEFQVTWIKMADIEHEIVHEYAKKSLTEFNFEDIFLSADFNEDNVTCPDGYKRIDWEESECLKLNEKTPNVEMLAAGLESRRMIPYVGATSEFTKMEGLAHDIARDTLYMSISFQRGPMAPNVPEGGQDDIRVKPNYCGCAYRMDLDKGYNVYKMEVQICGTEITVNGTESCTLTEPCNPDNLDVMEGYPWLLISEDASYRKQDLFQMHNVETKKSVIVGSAEMGAEVASGWFQNRLDGWTYITANYQGFDRSPLGYLGPYKLDGVKSISWKPHEPRGRDYVNPYAPFGEKRR